MGLPSWASWACVDTRKLASAGTLQMPAPMTYCKRNLHFSSALFKISLVVFVVYGVRRQSAFCFCTFRAAARWRAMEACWLGYDVVEICANSVRILVVVVYSTSSQIACCILGAAAIYWCWLLGKGYSLEGFRPDCIKIDEYCYLSGRSAASRAICGASTLPLVRWRSHTVAQWLKQER